MPPHGLECGGYVINARGVAQVGETVHFLGCCVQPPCQFYRTDVLVHHFIEQQNFGRQTAWQFDNMLAWLSLGGRRYSAFVFNLKTAVGHVRMGRHGDVLGRRDNAAGYCPQNSHG